eukprot:CAMPEP_0203886580 /NCGR_PEP_ID=MMETSP0359-20131031/30377_1 /ASSEMBLY_ACC=CAM_ASM_000338 /TAXON_ID=268821 /ORGANISM="Scrippsiella Hangoei, Strain SHTV-5" /LENGTH=74 /DNA_ID=CAMNT_0050807431 /DNA_START=146 /DNA_END=367 /DNA_ORIENTATION=-
MILSLMQRVFCCSCASRVLRAWVEVGFPDLADPSGRTRSDDQTEMEAFSFAGQAGSSRRSQGHAPIPPPFQMHR